MNDLEKYVIAIIPEYYEDGTHNYNNAVKNAVKFLTDEKDGVIYFDLEDAKDEIKKLYDGTYYLSHGEADRPRYRIISSDIYDKIISRHDEPNEYDWDKFDGSCEGCLECRDCISFIIEQDRELILKNAIKKEK